MGILWCTGMAQGDADIDTEGVTPKGLKARRVQGAPREAIGSS